MLLPSSFNPLWSTPAGTASPADLWFVYRDNKLLVTTDQTPGLPPASPDGRPPLDADGIRCFGTLDGRLCWAAHATSPPPGMAFEPLRALFDRLPDCTLALAGRAAQVLEFDRTHRFCGACASPTQDGDGGRARCCPRCQTLAYPRLAPAMMVLVTREGAAGRELLLARGRRSATPMYSALAGFVEPSETLEDCVHREVREEVGLRVQALRYFRSQAWPFPHSLMMAFLAEYAGGEIVCDPSEIAEARWFPVERLPALPHRLSISRMLIDHAVTEARAARLPRLGT